MTPTRYTVVSPTENLVEENVLNTITNIAPTMTPFMSSLKRRGTKRVMFETPQDTLRRPRKNAVKQGSPATFNDQQSPTKVIGYTQLMDEGVKVADTAEAEAHYGYGSSMGYYVGKAGLNLKKDMELQLCNNNSAKIITGDTQGASPDVTAGETGSLSSWINENLISKFATSGAGARTLEKGGYDNATKRSKGYVVENSAGNAFSAPVAASYGDWTEQDIRNAIVMCAEQSDMVRVPMIMLSLKNREKFSRIFGKSGVVFSREQQIGPGRGAVTAKGSIKFYESDFGTHRVMFNRWMNPSWITLPDSRYFRLRFLQPYKVVPIARDGHARKRMLKVEFGLESRAEKASALIVGVKDGDSNPVDPATESSLPDQASPEA